MMDINIHRWWTEYSFKYTILTNTLITLHCVTVCTFFLHFLNRPCADVYCFIKLFYICTIIATYIRFCISYTSVC